MCVGAFIAIAATFLRTMILQFYKQINYTVLQINRHNKV